MSYKAVKLTKRKHKLYKKYGDAKHPAYVKANRAANPEIRRAKRSFEKKLAMNIDAEGSHSLPMRGVALELDVKLVPWLTP